MDFLILLGGLVMIIAGANFLVDGASSVAKKFNISNLVIGLTVVAFGTSAPELTVSIYSALQGESDIALGNAIGSNIFNVLFILGLTAIIYPLKVNSSTVWKEIPLSLLAAIMIMVFASDALIDQASTSVVSRADGIALLGFMSIFLFYTFESARKQSADELHNTVVLRPVWLSVLMVVGGLVLLVGGGKLLVDGAVSIALGLGVSKSVIGLTIVSIGTSVPELATSIVAAYKKNADIAVGNVVGSNIFNIFFILGASSTIQPLAVGNITPIDLGVCVLVSLVLFLFAYNRKVSRLEGVLLMLGYVAYTAHLLSANQG